MRLSVTRRPLELAEKPWQVWVESKGPGHDRDFCARLLDGFTASPSDSKEGLVDFGLDLEDKIMSFDWREVMTKSFMESTKWDEHFFDKLV